MIKRIEKQKKVVNFKLNQSKRVVNFKLNRLKRVVNIKKNKKIIMNISKVSSKCKS